MSVDRYDDDPAETPFKLGLHHVQLALPPGGEDDCRRFYIDILGLTEVEKPPVLAARGGLWVRADSLEIHLGVEEDFRPQKKAHPGILVHDLDALAAQVEAHGLTPEWDENLPNMRRFYLPDNNGNRLEFLSSES
ncbi:glyoxalase [Arthrobacter tumbae]|uniref:glyoxalase n=1 Tax=Arthrobacter tumbae TaxID=163874 RepID=UPI00195ED4ED|nr:glyoxalase [Arthrobacter tumbae]MBM7780321.1 catechol 2,3-dioxygenase-like lactoylglutathione lyase family enzyme [Arthrobacter tumbae]